jgi:hypothetical protein
MSEKCPSTLVKESSGKVIVPSVHRVRMVEYVVYIGSLSQLLHRGPAVGTGARS